MLDDQARRGPGLSGITRDSGQRLTADVRRRALTGRAPGSVLIAVAAWLLAPTSGGALFVSFAAQYTFILTVRRQDTASVIEALLLDLLMIVFTLLALGLSRVGQSARAERALILLCAAASSCMNVSAADVASPRSVAAYAVAPVALTVVVDRVVAVIRRPSRRGALGLDHRGPRRGGHGQDRRAGAVVLSAVRPGRAGDGPGPAPDGAPPWPPNGTAPTPAAAPTSPAPWSSTTAGCPAPRAASPASPAHACRNARCSAAPESGLLVPDSADTCAAPD